MANPVLLGAVLEKPNSDLPDYMRDDSQFDLLDRSLHLDSYVFMT